ncbi:Spy/CpxP family protein refolding chaperone [Maribacter sp. 2210JD10-5]|uniref:Spy/CpxP family protein refolding chaperone n=1 Tax=Maribacter sp. 2210JD10-5 TaxID=3386272 RepID=UPI0039BCB6DF
MKKIIFICLLLLGVTLNAQQRQQKDHRKAMIQNLTAAQIGNLEAKKMTLALDLTDSQQSKIKSLFTERAAERKTKMEERKAARENEESKKPSPEERYAMANERLDERIAFKKEVKTILNAEQYSKWEALQEKQKKRHKKKKKGHHSER